MRPARHRQSGSVARGGRAGARAAPHGSLARGMVPIAVGVAAALAALLVVVVCQGTGLADAAPSQPWAMPMGNAQRTGLSESDTSGNWGTMAWSVELGSGYGDMLVRSDGSLIVCSGDMVKEYLADGSPGWSARIDEGHLLHLAMAEGGTVYALARTNDSTILHALSSTGEALWSYTGIEGFTEEPVVAPDGTVYVMGSYKGQSLYAVAPDGTLRWRVELGTGGTNGGVALGTDGTVYAAGQSLKAIWPNGTQEWEVELLYRPSAPPMVGPDGTVYMVLSSGGLYAITRGAGCNLLCAAPTQSYMDLALGPDGTIYTEAPGGGLQAVMPNGTLRWTLDVEGEVASTMAVAAEGTVYFGTGNGALMAVGPDGRPRWCYLPPSTGLTLGNPWDPAIGPNGTVHVIFGRGPGASLSLQPLVTLATRCVVGDTRDPGGGAPPASAWPALRGGPGHTGLGGAGVVTHGGSELWSYEGSSRYWYAPVIGPDGTLYLGSESGQLIAIGPEGDRLWTCPLGSGVSDSPAIGLNGTVLVTTQDGHLIAVGPDGAIEWDTVVGEALSSPAVGRGGVIYAGTSSGDLVAFNPWGSVRWSLSTGQGVVRAPAVGPDGTVYFTTAGSMLFSVDPSGKVLWASLLQQSEKRWQRPSPSWPCVRPDGSVLVAVEGTIVAISPDGRPDWSFVVEGTTLTAPSVGPDGTVYAGSSKDELIAIAPGGAVRWRFACTDVVEAPPAITSDGLVLFCCHNVTVALFANGSLAWHLPLWSERHGMFIYDNCPAGVIVGPNGTVYTTFFGSGVQAIGAGGDGGDGGGGGGGTGGQDERLYRVGFWACLAMALLTFTAFITTNARAVMAARKEARAKAPSRPPYAQQTPWPAPPPAGTYWLPQQWQSYPPYYPYGPNAQYPAGPPYPPPYPQYPMYPQQAPAQGATAPPPAPASGPPPLPKRLPPPEP